jgi:AcrR family transcriptional regulator
MAPQRAPSLPAEERRAMIVSATLHLLVEHGPLVTTKQIAEAAGIAEGTIFRVFCDKDTLVDAAVEAAFDTAALEQSIAAIDPHLAFEDKLAEAVRIMQARHAEIWRLMSNLGSRGPDKPARALADIASLAALLASGHDALRRDPVLAARILRALTLALSPPLFADDRPVPPAEVVALFLDGVRVSDREAQPC